MTLTKEQKQDELATIEQLLKDDGLTFDQVLELQDRKFELKQSLGLVNVNTDKPEDCENCSA